MAPSSDFKRLKAKVGKRAPKAANVTDTSFSSASVQVRSQSISHHHDNDSSSSKKKKEVVVEELTSSRGLPLQKLLQMLRHPSPIVRCSGLKGIQDAISIPSSSSSRQEGQEEEGEEEEEKREAVKLHLSILIPNIIKCIVDEDDDVRSACLSSLRTLLFDTLKTSSSSSSSSRRNKVLLLRPFLPLLIAYISSSLNSLDQETKVNGTEAILLLCNFFGSEFFLKDDGCYYVEELLPPYIALLPQSLSLKHKMTRKEKREKRNRRNKQQKGGEKENEEEEEEEEGGVILQSFVALLSTMHSSSSSVYSNNTFFETNTNDASSSSSSSLRRINDEESYVPLLQPADLQFVQGNVASNALLLYLSSSSSSSSSTNCSNIRNLPPIFRLEENSNSSMIPSSSTKQQQQQNTNCSSLKNNAQQAIPLLFTKLRDLYVEVTQDKSNHSSSSSSNGCCLFVHRSNLPTMRLILRGIQLLWKFYCHPLLLPLEEGKEGGGGGVQDSSQALVLKMGKNVHSLLLQSFPVRNEHSVGIGGGGNSRRKRRSRKEEDDVVVQTQQEKEEEEMYEVVNGLFCSILSEMGNTLSATFSSSSFSQKTTTTTTTKRKNVHGAQGTTDSGSTSTSSSTTWVEKVFAYVLPRLDSSSSLSNHDDDDGSGSGSTTNNANVTILKVISQLLLLQPQQNNNNQRKYLLEHFQDRKMLLIKFGQAFFGLTKKRKEQEKSKEFFLESSSSSPPSLQTCMSPSGKYAVLLLCKLIVQEFTFFHFDCNDDDYDDDTTLQTFDKKKEEEEEKDQKNSKEKNNQNVTTTILMQMMYALPTYLQHWGNNNNNNTTTTVNNVEEITMILGILLSVVRRIKVEKQSNNNKNNNNKKEQECQALVQALRLSIGVLFQSDTKKKKKRKNKKKKNSKRKRSNNNNNNNNDDDEYEDAKDDTTATTVTTTPITHSSIFEKLPSHTQKLAVSLLGMMSYPTEDVVKSCARVCARCAIHSNSSSSSSTTDVVVVVSNEMADYIMQTMYDMRKSMHMSLYLSFVIECVGIGGLDDIVVVDDVVDDDDDNVEKKQQQKEEQEEEEHLQKKQKLGHADGDKSPPNIENDTREEKRSKSTVSSIASQVTIDATRLFQRDLAIVRTCNYISRCCRIGSSNINNNTNNSASKKILSTLGPILTSWFTATEDEDSDDDTLISDKSNKNDVMGSTMKRRRTTTTTRYLSRVRAATSILSSIAIDGQQQSLSSSSFCVLEIFPNMEDLLRNVIQNTFLGNVRIVANSNSGAGAGKGSTAKENAVQNEIYVRFLSPLVALLSSQTQIVDMFLDQAHRLICSNDDNEAKAKEEKKQWKTNSDNNRDKAILRVFLLLLKQPTLSAVWRDVHISKRLVNIAESIECAVANGPLDRIGGELRTEVNMLVVGCR